MSPMFMPQLHLNGPRAPRWRHESSMAASRSGVASSVGQPYDDHNVFAKIIRGELPCVKLMETPHALAILDAFPKARGHALLLPKAGYASLADCPPKSGVAEALKELPRLTRAVMEATGAEGVTIIQNNGASAGQEVFHVHFHLIPRFARDGLVRLAPSSPEMVPREEAEALARDIRERLASPGPGVTSTPPKPGTPLARLLDAHALVLAAHQDVHERVDALVVALVRLVFGRLLG